MMYSFDASNRICSLISHYRFVFGVHFVHLFVLVIVIIKCFQGIEAISKVYMHKPTTDDKKRTLITPEGSFKVRRDRK